MMRAQQRKICLLGVSPLAHALAPLPCPCAGRIFEIDVNSEQDACTAKEGLCNGCLSPCSCLSSPLSHLDAGRIFKIAVGSEQDACTAKEGSFHRCLSLAHALAPIPCPCAGKKHLK